LTLFTTPVTYLALDRFRSKKHDAVLAPVPPLPGDASPLV
jgi:hypothetical protein